MASSETRVGVSGWSYPHWRGPFYPPGLPQKQEFQYACRHFTSLEINASFYALKRPEHYRAWYQNSPPNYVFAVKGGRFITHMKRLREVETPLANFFASGLLLLREKLGPVLWQLPANLTLQPERVRRFLDLLPRSHREAADLAKRHDDRLAGRCQSEALVKRPLRHAIEVRNSSFFTAEFARLLRAKGIALVFADSGGRWPYLEEITADFLYLRLHGARETYLSGYTDAELDWWTERIRIWSAGGQPADARTLLAPTPVSQRDVYVYFDNDARAHAPFDAARLARRLAAKAPGTAADGRC